MLLPRSAPERGFGLYEEVLAVVERCWRAIIVDMESEAGARSRAQAAGPRAASRGAALAASHLEPTFERLEELANLEPDWDGYEGRPPSSQATAIAGCLVAGAWDRFGAQYDERAQPYEIMPIADGGLQLEWRGSAERLHLNVGPDSRISFLHVVGHGAQRAYREGDDLSRTDAYALLERVIRD